ncbi:hypothetical protein [Pseudofrankia sp. BMG5.36]|uniref:hypothetical protein n=1 Tax=Pseudofrankia sp. BMG5.36 TaxID=1834512 RepID=UPI0010422D66|nr:hypothetical protein [Pseudofrankia sp. BMG5.36]
MSYGEGYSSRYDPRPSHIAFAPAGDEILVGTRQGDVGVNFSSGSKGVGRSFSVAGRSPIVDIVSIGETAIVVAAAENGNIEVSDWISASRLLSIKTGKRIRALAASPCGAFLAGTYHDGTIELWDLRALKIAYLFQLPLVDATPDHLTQVQDAVAHGLPPRLRPHVEALGAVLQYRFRHVIQVGEHYGPERG